MSDINISYKGESIATMDATGTKTLLTSGKYCEDDIEIEYTKPSSPSMTFLTATKKLTTAAQSISFEELDHEPTMFIMRPKFSASVTKASSSSAATPRRIVCLYWLGSGDICGNYLGAGYSSSSIAPIPETVSNPPKGVTATYSDGTLTFTSSGTSTTPVGYFFNTTYELLYL